MRGIDLATGEQRMSALTGMDRVGEWCEKLWQTELERMNAGLDYRESFARVAAGHTLKQVLQLPAGLGAIYGCLSAIRLTLVVIAILLAAITYRMYA
jgi:hypothetical protein